MQIIIYSPTSYFTRDFKLEQFAIKNMPIIFMEGITRALKPIRKLLMEVCKLI